MAPVSKVQLVSHYACYIRKTSKEWSFFSNKELLKCKTAKAWGKSASASTPELRCKACGDEAARKALERQCPRCGLVKDLSAFSKNSRTKGDGRCMECVMWVNSVEPGKSTGSEPNSENAPDISDSVYGFDPDAESDWDDDCEDVKPLNFPAEGNQEDTSKTSSAPPAPATSPSVPSVVDNMASLSVSVSETRPPVRSSSPWARPIGSRTESQAEHVEERVLAAPSQPEERIRGLYGAEDDDESESE